MAPVGLQQLEVLRVVLGLAVLSLSLVAQEAVPEDSLWWSPARAQVLAAESAGIPVACRNALDMEFVLIPRGTYTMGAPMSESNPQLGKWERDPIQEWQHEVRLTRSFLMQATEVTQSQFQAVMGYNPSCRLGESLPADSLTWYDALVFCNELSKLDGLNPCYELTRISKDRRSGAITKARVEFLGLNQSGYRLPTDAEWEYACRAGTQTPFWSGDALLLEHANVMEMDSEWGGHTPNSLFAPAPVASYDPNPWGLFDMHGNVSELCWDVKRHFDERFDGIVEDPTGPASGYFVVCRGGDWASVAHLARSAARPRFDKDDQGSATGFRVVRSFIEE